VAAYSRLEWAAKPLTAHLGHLRPDQIDKRRWADYVAVRKVSAGTIRRERNVLIAALNRARDDDPSLQVPRIKPPAPPPPRQRYLTRAEADRLLAAFASPHTRLLATIMLLTGCRKGAALGLTWNRVDFDNNRIDFRDPALPESKKRRAIVPMSGKLRAAMLEAYGARASDVVIEWRGSSIAQVRTSFNKARRKAGLGPDVVPHILRHTAASWLAMSGIPIDQASDLLACDPTTLRRVYRKYDAGYLQSTVNALDAFL
jgi:integrase